MSGSAVVVGAGIAGLTAANALLRCGWDVRVLERSPEPRTTGAGIVLLANALRGLDAAGVGDAVRAIGERAYPGSLRDGAGRALVHVSPEQIAARLGTVAIAFHRPRLQEALLGGLGDTAVTYGAAAVSVDPGAADRPAVVTLEDGSTVSADLVVAADGVRSLLRAAVAPDAAEPVYVGSTTWLAVLDNPGITEMSQTWGPGGEVGLIPLGDGRLYWYATQVGPAGRPTGTPWRTWRPRARRSPAGTHPYRRCWPRPRRSRRSSSTCTGSPARSRGWLVAGWRWPVTPRTPCRRTWARVAARASRTPWCWRRRSRVRAT
nr:hypothetical protein GCM10025730_10760 [Promicromonospora thailandica]